MDNMAYYKKVLNLGGSRTMQHKKPIYITRKDTCLASDRIVPCGGKIGVSSESRRKESKLRLLGVQKGDKK